jgi:hypothetical protein
VSDLARFRDHDHGDLIPGGERVVGEIVEYAPPIIDQFPMHAYSGEQILELHRSRNAQRIAPPVRPGPFRRHSLRRFS